MEVGCGCDTGKWSVSLSALKHILRILVIFITSSVKMTEMSMIETLQLWSDGVSAMERGDYETTLKNFKALEGRTDSSQMLITSARNLFNIGKTYLNLGMVPEATEAFEQALEKDKMLAVAHFMLGCTNICADRNSEAVRNFDEALFYLRGNKLIDYKQLGLKYKLYDCEILTNRAISYCRIGEVDNARDDFLQAIQSKAEPRHSIIDDALYCWRSGIYIQHIELPANAVFRPAKTKVAAMNEKPDFLGQAKILVGKASVRKPPPPMTKPPKSINIGARQSGNQHMRSARDSLLTDLRKKETRKSLKKVETRGAPPSKPLPTLPGSPNINSRSLPHPRPASPRTVTNNKSPNRQRRSYDVSAAHDRPERSSLEISQPPNKPLPPSPRSRSPVMPRAPVPVKDASVTFQFVVTRTVKVSSKSSLKELSQAAAGALKLPEDSIALWYTRDNELTNLENCDIQNILQSASETEPTIFCYEK